MSETNKLPGILSFDPYYKSVLWGGSRIAKLKGIDIKDKNIGESWEMSDIPGCESIINSGEHKGKSLSQILSEYGNEIMGKRLMKRYDGKFPLLIKFIDAKQNLSIQVHPDDYLAAERHNCPGKTEMWYSIDPTPDAFIYSGLKEEVTPDTLESSIKDNTIEKLLSCYISRRGDLFYLPAGRIHSIGAGNLILEIQQSSDITYRIYDFDRVDASGNKRQLHVKEALDAIDYRVYDDYMRHFEPILNREIVLKQCPYFTTTIINATTRQHILVARFNSFRVLMCTHGSAYIVDPDGNSTFINQGMTLLVPAYMKYVEIAPSSSRVELLTTYII